MNSKTMERMIEKLETRERVTEKLLKNLEELMEKVAHELPSDLRNEEFSNIGIRNVSWNRGQFNETYWALYGEEGEDGYDILIPNNTNNIGVSEYLHGDYHCHVRYATTEQIIIFCSKIKPYLKQVISKIEEQNKELETILKNFS